MIAKSIQKGAPKLQGVDVPDGFAQDSADCWTPAASMVASGGGILSNELIGWYASQGFIGYQMCAIIAQHWLVNKACAQKGKDAARHWFKINVNEGVEVDDKVLSYMAEADERFDLYSNLTEGHRFNNVFGVRHILFKVESSDPQYYERPFNPDGIKPGEYKGMVQIDPYWMSPHMSSETAYDPLSKHFYEPDHWVVGGRKIHRSHFVILRGAEVADILKPTYNYGGIPLTQRIYERVYAAERTANEAPLLAMTKRLNVRKTDIDKALAHPDKFHEANEFLTNYRNNTGVLFVGKDEEMNQIETTLTDLDVTIMTQYQLVAAEADEPATKLLGTSPKGFNATGEHETESYNQTLETLQSEEFDPIVRKHHQCVMASEVIPKFGVKFKPCIKWNPVHVESRKEQAEINEINSRTAQNSINNGAVSPEEERERLASDPDSLYSGLGMKENEMPESEVTIPEDNTEEPQQSIESGQDEVIEKNGLFFVYSKGGKKRLSRGYPTEAQAYKRLGQIEGFKDAE